VHYEESHQIAMKGDNKYFEFTQTDSGVKEMKEIPFLPTDSFLTI
jgi:hypothetical protein